MKTYLLISLLLLFQLLFSPGGTWAGKLDDFEKDIAEKKPRPTKRTAVYDKQRNPITGQAYPDSIEDEVFGNLAGSILSGLAVFYSLGIDGSLQRIRGNRNQGEGYLYTPRELGEPLIPYLPTDIRYQDVESDIEAIDSRVEAGYGPFAIQGRWTHYDEQSLTTN